MKIATLIQTLNELAEQGYTDMIGAKLGEYGLIIELEETNPPEVEPGLVQGVTHLPNGGTLIHHVEGKALLSINDELIEQLESEAGNENQAASSDLREDVISASPDYSCEISGPFHNEYRVILRGFGKVAAAFPKDANGQEERE